MTGFVHVQGFDAKAYAEFQALFDVPAGRAAPYILPPKRPGGPGLVAPAEQLPETAPDAEPAGEGELRLPPRAEAGSTQSPSPSAGSDATGGANSSTPSQGSDGAADNAAARAERAAIEAVVQREVARQVREFLQSDAGRETLMRELQGVRRTPPRT